MDYEQLAKRSLGLVTPELTPQSGAVVDVNGTQMRVSNGEGLLLQIVAGLEKRITGVANDVVAIREALTAPDVRKCANCRRVMPENLRRSAKYCTESCKQSAYLARKGGSQHRKD